MVFYEDEDLPSIAWWSRAYAMEFPAKIYVQIISDNVKYFTAHHLPLGISQLQCL